MKRTPWKIWPLAAGICAAGFAGGWLVKSIAASRTPTPDPLRLSGYQFISPLLSCNFTGVGLAPEDKSMNTAITSVINAHVQAGDISKASVYFADFSNSKWAEAYPDDKYYPSSLGKIPIMMAYYEMAESSPNILDQRILYPDGGQNLNDEQDIAPAQAIIPGQTYSVDELIDYMIKYSDNNAAQLLYENIDQSALRSVYDDLQIPVNDDATLANLDFITPRQIGTLFRILYNATYLSHDYSEKALALMSESSFTQGLVAGTQAAVGTSGVSSSTITGITVSHKLGLVGIDTNGDGIDDEHELHDCGIVYAPNHPYLLCVMTRGSSSLPTMEGVISDVSKTVYQAVESH